MDERDRPKPVPSDTELSVWLEKEIEEHTEELREELYELLEVVDKKKEDGEPVNFAYGKLLNYLASEYVPEPKKIRCLAAAMWRILKLEDNL